MSHPSATAPIRDVVAAFASGDATPDSVLERTIEVIEAAEPLINSLAAVDHERARATAAASTRRWREGTQIGPFDGVPVTLKDSIASVGRPWRHGLRAHRDLPPMSRATPPAERLDEAGAVVVGVTTMPDMGMLGSGISSLYGVTRNPWDTAFSPGGSSSGAGASLAAGIGYAAVGSDIAGSVRLPAAHCGLAALKPTQGRIPHVPASTMRSAGPMARWVDDVELLLDVIGVPDARDIYALPPELPFEERGPARIGVLLDLGYGEPAVPEVRAAVQDAAAALVAAGHDVTEVPVPFDTDPGPVFDRIFAVRAFQELGALAPGRRGESLDVVREWADRTGDVSAAQYSDDLGAALAAAVRFVDATRAWDYILTPVLPMVGFAAEAAGPFSPPLSHATFTAIANQTQQPAGTVAWHVGEQRLPIGVQVIGAKFDDRGVLRILKQIESARVGWPGWPVGGGRRS